MHGICHLIYLLLITKEGYIIIRTTLCGPVVECTPGIWEVVDSFPSQVIPTTLKMEWYLAPHAKRSALKGKTKELWLVYPLSTVKYDQVGKYINVPAIWHSLVEAPYLLQVGTITI